MNSEIIGEILKNRGIRLKIGACGCCDSPWVAIEIDGTLVVGTTKDGKVVEEGSYGFNNFGESE